MTAQEYIIPSFSSKEERLRWFEEESLQITQYAKDFDETTKMVGAQDYLLALRCLLTFHLQNMCVPYSDQHVVILSALLDKLNDRYIPVPMHRILSERNVLALGRWEEITPQECQACLHSLSFDRRQYPDNY